MLVEEELAKQSPEKDMLLTIGVFDGVHLGHKYLISQLKAFARERNLLSGLVTFSQHPREVLLTRTELPYLTSLDEKVRLLRDEGVDAAIVLSFTRELAGLGAGEFIALLKKYLKMRGLVVGPDFALGRGREGNIDALRRLGGKMDFSVSVVAPMKVNDEVVSSTAIRKLLAAGDIKRVNSLIGRAFSLQGEVATGVGRGSELGFPTVNLRVGLKQALPADGVYATRTHLGNRAYNSVTNIGRRPTFDEHNRTIETYILDYKGDLYGRELKIEFVERLRDERRFSSVEALKKQIAEDVKQGMAILESRGGK